MIIINFINYLDRNEPFQISFSFFLNCRPKVSATAEPFRQGNFLLMQKSQNITCPSLTMRQDKLPRFNWLDCFQVYLIFVRKRPEATRIEHPKCPIIWLDPGVLIQIFLTIIILRRAEGVIR